MYTTFLDRVTFSGRQCIWGTGLGRRQIWRAPHRTTAALLAWTDARGLGPRCSSLWASNMGLLSFFRHAHVDRSPVISVRTRTKSFKCDYTKTTTRHWHCLNYSRSTKNLVKKTVVSETFEACLRYTLAQNAIKFESTFSSAQLTSVNVFLAWLQEGTRAKGGCERTI